MKARKKMKFDIDYLFLNQVLDLANIKHSVLTHYLQDSQNKNSNTFKEDAILFTKNILQTKYANETITLQIAEEILQYGLFDFINIPFKPPLNAKFKFIDLFAGVGGFRLALQNSGGKCVYSSEWEINAKLTYKENFGDIPFGDITLTETKNYIPQDFDILCAGFPCQAFSVAGVTKKDSKIHGNIIFEVEKIIEKHRPKVVFLENVKTWFLMTKEKLLKLFLKS